MRLQWFISFYAFSLISATLKGQDATLPISSKVYFNETDSVELDSSTLFVEPCDYPEPLFSQEELNNQIFAQISLDSVENIGCSEVSFYIEFIIDEEGWTDLHKVVKSTCSELDSLVLSVMSRNDNALKFSPLICKGVPRKSRYVQKFSLEIN